MRCPQCTEPMTTGIVMIHHNPMNLLGGSAHRDKHLYFMPRGEGNETMIASGRDMTEAFRCESCSLTVLTANTTPRP